MASKRMFANALIDSDAFLDLSPMQQLTYFHLGMKTDDDGFVSGAKRIARIIGAAESDIQSLIDNGFLIEFPESKVYVVVHHRQNNDLKNDRYHRTNYKNEYDQLELTPNKEYKRKQLVSNMDTDCFRDVSNMSTEQNVTKPNVTKPNVAQRSKGKGSAEGETQIALLLLDCKNRGLNPDSVLPLINRYGIPKVHDALVRWQNSEQGADVFEEFIGETEE